MSAPDRALHQSRRFFVRQSGRSGDQALLLARHCRHDPHREPVRGRQVGRHEVNPGLLQPEQEVRIAAEPVELGDDELRATETTGQEHLCECWAIQEGFEPLSQAREWGLADLQSAETVGLWGLPSGLAEFALAAPGPSFLTRDGSPGRHSPSLHRAYARQSQLS